MRCHPVQLGAEGNDGGIQYASSVMKFGVVSNSDRRLIINVKHDERCDRLMLFGETCEE